MIKNMPPSGIRFVVLLSAIFVLSGCVVPPTSPSLINTPSIHEAARRGNLEMIRQLLSHGQNVDQPDTQELTALVFATTHGHEEIVKFLLEHGAQVNRPGRAGWTALHAAARHGHIPCINRLLQAGADLEAIWLEGETPLKMAVTYADPQTVTFLIDHGANLNHEAPDGGTALLHAVMGHGDTMVRLLLQRGAYPDGGEHAPFTPLMLATTYSDFTVVAALLNHHASLTKTDINGQTALHWAAQLGSAKTVQMLLAAGADASFLDHNESTPLDLALAREGEEGQRITDLIEKNLPADAK